MNRLLKITLALLPIPILVIVAFCITNTAYKNAFSNIPIASILFSDNKVGVETDITPGDKLIVPETIEFPSGIEYTDEKFTVPGYGTKWATLNVSRWDTVDIPVYFGDTGEILASGAGQWIGSYFCGHGKTCILKANVTTWFYEIEDTDIGCEVTMQTTYGNYRYEVTDKYVFSEDDIDLLYEDLGEDTLILHTSHPRSAAVGESTNRIALVCSLKDGMLYRNAYESSN